MTSKISLAKLMREDMRHRLWMIILSCLAQLICGPLLVLFAGSLIRTQEMDEEVYSVPLSNIYNQLTTIMEINRVLIVVIAVVGAIIVGVWGFKHLFSRRILDLYNSTAVSRNAQFWTFYLNGLLIWLLPFLVATLFSTIFACAVLPDRVFVLSILGFYLLNIVLGLICFLIVYHLILVAVCLSGTIMNTLITAFLLGTDVAIGVGLYLLMMQCLFETFMPSSVTFTFLSNLAPLTSPFVICYQLVTDCTFAEMFSSLLFSTIILVINLFIAYFLYITRKTEVAECGITNHYVRTALTWINGIMAGIFISLFARILILDLYDFESGVLFWSLLSGFIAAVIVSGFLEVIFQHSLKALWSRKWQIMIPAAITVVFFGVMESNLLDYDTYLPAQSNIKDAYFSCSTLKGEGQNLVFFDDGTVEYYWNVSNNFYGNDEMDDSYFISDSDVIYPLLQAATKYQAEKEDSYSSGMVSFVIRVDRNFGIPYYRQYSIAKEDIEVLRPIVETEGYMEKYYPLESGMRAVPTYINVEPTWEYRNNLTLVYEDCNRFYEAYVKDFRENYTLENLLTHLEIGDIRFEYPVHAMDSKSTRTISLSMSPDYKRCLEISEDYYGKNWYLASNYHLYNFQTITDSIRCPEDRLNDYIDAYLKKPGARDMNDYSYFYDYSNPESEPYDMYLLPIYDLLPEMSDDIILGTICDYSEINDYVRIGYIDVPYSDYGQNSENTTSVECFIHKDKIPAELSERFYFQSRANSSYDYYYDYVYDEEISLEH